MQITLELPEDIAAHLAGTVLQIEQQNFERTHGVPGERMNPSSRTQSELPEKGGLAGACGSGDKHPVATFDEIGDEPVVCVGRRLLVGRGCRAARLVQRFGRAVLWPVGLPRLHPGWDRSRRQPC